MENPHHAMAVTEVAPSHKLFRVQVTSVEKQSHPEDCFQGP